MDVMTQTSEDLARAAAAGDRAAFGRLLERHYGVILKLAARHSEGPAGAEDLAQDICVKLARNIASFDGRAKFSTWLYALALNACRDHLRKLGRERRKRAEYGDFARLALEDAAEAARRAQILREMLDELDEPLRETALLVLDHDLSHAEAAAILGVKESTISWRLHEIRKRLKGQRQ
jgi:RNA polymerase sigma-70 factor (ECF subfamily)